jgi:hypothetical protein
MNQRNLAERDFVHSAASVGVKEKKTKRMDKDGKCLPAVSIPWKRSELFFEQERFRTRDTVVGGYANRAIPNARKSHKRLTES